MIYDVPFYIPLTSERPGSSSFSKFYDFASVNCVPIFVREYTAIRLTFVRKKKKNDRFVRRYETKFIHYLYSDKLRQP